MDVAVTKDEVAGIKFVQGATSPQGDSRPQVQLCEGERRHRAKTPPRMMAVTYSISHAARKPCGGGGNLKITSITVYVARTYYIL